jgi:broad specificity phosphatase PhoE
MGESAGASGGDSKHAAGLTTIYLVRHGESEANVQRVFSNGKVDLPLTALGRQQAAQAAAWLAGSQAVHVFSAPLLRARQTADLIAQTLGIGTSVLADLDEIRVGELDGRRDEASWALHDRVIARWRAGHRRAGFPGGETFGQAHDRFSAALQEMAERYPGQTVVAVSHGAIQMTVIPRLCPSLGQELRRARQRWGLRNAAITQLDVSPEGIVCPMWGSTDHVVPLTVS